MKARRPSDTVSIAGTVRALDESQGDSFREHLHRELRDDDEPLCRMGLGAPYEHLLAFWPTRRDAPPQPFPPPVVVCQRCGESVAPGPEWWCDECAESFAYRTNVLLEPLTMVAYAMDGEYEPVVMDWTDIDTDLFKGEDAAIEQADTDIRWLQKAFGNGAIVKSVKRRPK